MRQAFQAHTVDINGVARRRCVQDKVSYIKRVEDLKWFEVKCPFCTGHKGVYVSDEKQQKVTVHQKEIEVQ